MYNYKEEKKKIFTEDGQEKFLKIRDKIQSLLSEAGAFTMGKAIQGILGDTWVSMACVDRLIELKEITEITEQGKVRGQDKVFVSYNI